MSVNVSPMRSHYSEQYSEQSLKEVLLNRTERSVTLENPYTFLDKDKLEKFSRFAELNKVKTVKFRDRKDAKLVEYPLKSYIAVLSNFPNIPERGKVILKDYFNPKPYTDDHIASPTDISLLNISLLNILLPERDFFCDGIRYTINPETKWCFRIYGRGIYE